MLTLLIICLIVFIPTAVVVSSLAVEFNALYNRIQANQTELTTVATSVVNHLPEWLRHFLAENNLNDANAIQQKLSGVAMKGAVLCRQPDDDR